MSRWGASRTLTSHPVGTFPELEDQRCAFTADNIAASSPDRANALVWGFTDLMFQPPQPGFLRYMELELKRLGRWEECLKRMREQEEGCAG